MTTTVLFGVAGAADEEAFGGDIVAMGGMPAHGVGQELCQEFGGGIVAMGGMPEHGVGQEHVSAHGVGAHPHIGHVLVAGESHPPGANGWASAFHISTSTRMLSIIDILSQNSYGHIHI